MRCSNVAEILRLNPKASKMQPGHNQLVRIFQGDLEVRRGKRTVVVEQHGHYRDSGESMRHKLGVSVPYDRFELLRVEVYRGIGRRLFDIRRFGRRPGRPG